MGNFIVCMRHIHIPTRMKQLSHCAIYILLSFFYTPTEMIMSSNWLKIRRFTCIQCFQKNTPLINYRFFICQKITFMLLYGTKRGILMRKDYKSSKLDEMKKIVEKYILFWEQKPVSFPSIRTAPISYRPVL